MNKNKCKTLKKKYKKKHGTLLNYLGKLAIFSNRKCDKYYVFIQ